MYQTRHFKSITGTTLMSKKAWAIVINHITELSTWKIFNLSFKILFSEQPTHARV